MSTPVVWAITLVVAYLIGALPSGILVGRLWRGVDIRRYGSGGSGATNVLRTLGPAAGATVFILDVIKGSVPVLIAELLSDSAGLKATAGTLAVVGHVWPVYVGFKGGKGVATAIGAVVVLSPFAAGTAALGLAVAYVTKYVSVGSLAGATTGLALMGILVAFGYYEITYLAFVLPAYALIVRSHYANLLRLRRGRENRLTPRAQPRRQHSREQ